MDCSIVDFVKNTFFSNNRLNAQFTFGITKIRLIFIDIEN